MVLMYLCCS